MRNMFLALVCVFVLSACGAEPTVDAGPVDSAAIVTVDSEPVTAFVRGQLAQSTNIYEVGQFETAHSNSSSAMIKFSTPTNDRAVMSMLMLNGGGLDHEDLSVGNAYTLQRYETTENGLQLVIVGCEGQRVGVWDYDNPASAVSIVVTEPSPNVRRINYIATWAAYLSDGEVDDRLSGYFDITE